MFDILADRTYRHLFLAQVVQVVVEAENLAKALLLFSELLS